MLVALANWHILTKANACAHRAYTRARSGAPVFCRGNRGGVGGAVGDLLSAAKTPANPRPRGAYLRASARIKGLSPIGKNAILKFQSRFLMTSHRLGSVGLGVFNNEVSVMHPGDLTLRSDMASCTKLSIVRASSESYNDLIVLNNDRGRSADEFIEGRASCKTHLSPPVLRLL